MYQCQPPIYESADAQVPELDEDVGTGTEGDVEARCFSERSFLLRLVVRH